MRPFTSLFWQADSTARQSLRLSKERIQELQRKEGKIATAIREGQFCLNTLPVK